MPSSNRLYQFAVGGCLAAFLLAVPALSQADQKHQTQISAQSEQDQPATTPRMAADENDLTSEEYQNPCGPTKKADVADLCEQRRMAEAAIRQVDWVRAQFWATIGEIFLLVLVVIVSGWAAWEASGSAKAAQRAATATETAVKVASDTAERQLRAYVTMRSCIVEFGNNRIIKIKIVVKNTGQTPALKIHCANEIGVGLPESFSITADSDPDINTVAAGDLGAGIDFTNDYSIGPIDPDVWMKVRDRSVPIFVWGEYRYWDIFKRERRHTRYRMTLHPTDDGLSPYPGGNEVA